MRLLIFVFFAFGLASPSLRAARPFVTDDARLTNAGACQLESWTRVYSDSRELWALPACNPSGNLEVTLGAGLARTNGQAQTDDYVLQFKTLFQSLTTNGWGMGLAAGTVTHTNPQPGPNGLGNQYIYVPLSRSLDDDRWIIHHNIGMIRDRASGLYSATYGLGGEAQINARLLGIAEVYGDSRGNSFGQVGFRYAIIPDLFQVDTTLGNGLGGPNKRPWISIGLRYTPTSF